MYSRASPSRRKPVFSRRFPGCLVRRQARRFDAMQPERAENERDERLGGVEHVALARERLARPVAQTAGLRHAAPNIGKRAAAEQRMVLRAEHEEGIGGIQTRLALVALEPAPERAAAELVRCPDGLPRREKGAALAPEARPRQEILEARVAQIDMLALDDGQLPAGKGQAPHECHGAGIHSAAARVSPAPKRCAKRCWLSSCLAGPTAAIAG